MHYRGDGQVKRSLSATTAERMRAEGWKTYMCPLCGKTHASKKPVTV